MLSIVVTGAHGFIGTNLVDKLLQLSPEELFYDKPVSPRFSSFEKNGDVGFSVIASDLQRSLTNQNAKRFIGSARYDYQDYENLVPYLRALPKKPEFVIHNGACSSTTETDPTIFAKQNLDYSKALWDYCTQEDIPFIYASSASVYGDGTLGFSDKKEHCQNYTALNLYGKSKLDFDLWVLQQSKTPPSWFGLRYFNVYGPFESHKGSQASMVMHGYHQATRTGKICLFQSNTPEYQNGEQCRDFIFVDDIVAITVDLLKLVRQRRLQPNAVLLPENGVFLNIGVGKTETWNHLARCVFEALNVPTSAAAIEYIPM
ncbi:MAG: NAD-dependent epimerase/dehydratase family protein, partial [Silvanigrellaceae bacterium]|nr:NAD-dependent epimerase/dehydratase family protein [Silvanigrellaceae bacterium]